MSHVISASHSKKFSSDFGPGDHVRTATMDDIHKHNPIVPATIPSGEFRVNSEIRNKHACILYAGSLYNKAIL